MACGEVTARAEAAPASARAGRGELSSSLGLTLLTLAAG